jgi:YbbR domain-containing protein
MKTKGFWARLASDWPAKVLSIAAALLLFFFYRLNRLEERYLSVPLQVTTNDEFVPASQYPRSVRLALKGESNDLFDIQESDIKASIDLSGVKAVGLSRAVVAIEKKGGALGIDPLEIRPDPAEVSVAMERRSSRVVPVTPAFHGYLEPGYNLKAFDISPGEVQIIGPESAISRLSDMTTEPIELTGKMSDFAVKARIVHSSALVQVSGSDVVEFRGTVEKSMAVKSFVAMAILAENLQADLVLETPLPTARINVKSASSDVHAIDLPPGAVAVDFSGLRRPGSYTLPVVVVLPEGISLESLEPASVTVRIVPKSGRPGGDN